MTGQFLQALGDQRGGLCDITAALRDPRMQEGELWPGKRRADGEPVQQLILGGSREPVQEHLVPGCEVLGTLVAPVASLVETSVRGAWSHRVLSGRIRVRGTILLGLASMIAGCARMLVVQSDTPPTEIAAHQMLLGGAPGIVVPR